MRVITNLHKPNMLASYDRGEANGYLIIEDSWHPWYGEHYDSIDVNVHGGLTFSTEIVEDMLEHYSELYVDDIGSWMIGFDTCHANDTAEKWPTYKVREHAVTHLLDVARMVAAEEANAMYNDEHYDPDMDPGDELALDIKNMEFELAAAIDAQVNAYISLKRAKERLDEYLIMIEEDYRSEQEG